MAELKSIKKIKQMLPAENWFMEHGPDNEKPSMVRLVCWVIYEDEKGEDFITGMFYGPVADLVSCVNTPFFKSYKYWTPEEQKNKNFR